MILNKLVLGNIAISQIMVEIFATVAAPRNRKAHELEAIEEINSSSEGRALVVEKCFTSCPSSSTSFNTSIPTAMSETANMLSFSGR